MNVSPSPRKLIAGLALLILGLSSPVHAGHAVAQASTAAASLAAAKAQAPFDLATKQREGTAPYVAKHEAPLHLPDIGAEDPPRKQVLYFVGKSTPGKERLVAINWGKREGLLEGTLLRTVRLTDDGLDAPARIPTGQIKVIKVDSQSALATVVRDGSEFSAEAFPEHAGVMAGDGLERLSYTVSQRLQVLPRQALAYQELFADPKATPTTYEITREGRERLATASRTLGRQRLSLLFVKAYTDSEGSAAANQVESYQRALTVRQYLIEAQGFAPERVVAVGFGESDPADRSKTAGAAARNRRIVLELITPPPGR